ncbi:MAG TPA: hypothetical protein VFU31_24775 [Candidatus Binatia bacterium]|nr:hypothetical protein [Candidatus Binatia bacterium]
MCQVFKKETTLKKPMTIYKRSPFNDTSEYEPDRRSFIEPGDRGEYLQYKKGTTVVSPSGPGIMGYVSKPKGDKGIFYLRLRIPKGAVIRRGNDCGRALIAASKVFVIGRMK